MTDGVDNASSISINKLKKELQANKIHLVTLIMDEGADLTEVRELVRSSCRGLVFLPDEELHLTRVIEELLAYIFPRDSLSF